MVHYFRYFVFLALAFLANFFISAPTFAVTVYTYTGNEFTTFVPLVSGTNPPSLPYGDPTHLTFTLSLPDGVSLAQYSAAWSSFPGALTASDGSGYTGPWSIFDTPTFAVSSEGLPTSWYIHLVQGWVTCPPDSPFWVSASWSGGITSTTTADTAIQVMGHYGYERYGSFDQRSITASINGDPEVWSMMHLPDPPPPVPLPSTVLLLGSGLLGLAGWRRLRKG